MRVGRRIVLVLPEIGSRRHYISLIILYIYIIGYHADCLLITDILQAVEILPCGRQVYIYTTYLIPWLLTQGAKVVSSHGIDFIILEYSSFNTRRADINECIASKMYPLNKIIVSKYVSFLEYMYPCSETQNSPGWQICFYWQLQHHQWWQTWHHDYLWVAIFHILILNSYTLNENINIIKINLLENIENKLQ